VRAENGRLAALVESLSTRVEAVTARLARAPVDARAPEGRPPEARTGPAPSAAEPAPLVPEGLKVVRVGPPAARPPPVATSVAIAEPDPAALATLQRRSGRELSAEAEAELKAARGRDGLAKAHALEDFAARYPRHPQAATTLLSAATAYAEAQRDDAACRLAHRVADEYPASEAVADALWRLSTCESRLGAADAERRFLTRLVKEFPSTPAAQRAGERLAVISGRTGDSPAGVPARSGP